MRFLAYIDPGTGSVALQAVLGTLAGAAFVVRGWIGRTVNRFVKRSAPKETQE